MRDVLFRAPPVPATIDWVLLPKTSSATSWVGVIAARRWLSASTRRRFDYVIVLQSGRVIEQDKFEALDREGSALHALMQAD